MAIPLYLRYALILALCWSPGSPTIFPIGRLVAQETEVRPTQTTSSVRFVVLRDLTLLQESTVRSFDENGLQLVDGTRVYWDRVLKGEVSPDQQAEFDRWIQTVGLPVFRFRSRLATGAWLKTAEMLDSLKLIHPLPATVQFEMSAVEFLAHLDNGHREAAVTAYFEALWKVTRLRPDERSQYEGIEWAQRFLSRSPSITLAREITPVFFDENASLPSLESLSKLRNRWEARSQKKDELFDWGILVYEAALAIACEQEDTATNAISMLSSTNEAELWAQMLNSLLDLSQQQIPGNDSLQIFERMDSGQAAERSMALWLTAELQNLATPDRPIPEIYLKIAALNRQRDPGLASAALFQAMRKFPTASDDFRRLQKVVLTNFPRTYHARQLRSVTGAGTGVSK